MENSGEDNKATRVHLFSIGYPGMNAGSRSGEDIHEMFAVQSNMDGLV